MTPQQQVVVQQPLPRIISQKVQLTYKLFLLEHARNTLEQELLNFINKAYEEAQGFFSSSFPSSGFSDLAKALDSKCQAIAKLSDLLKDHTVEPHICAINGLRTNQLGKKGIPVRDVLKFGPMLQNSLMSSSIAKSVQALGVTLPLQQLKHLTSQHAAALEDNITCNIASSYNGAVVTTSSSSHLKADKKGFVIFEEEHPPDAVILPPAIIESPKISAVRSPILLPPTEAIFPETSNPRPMKIMPLIGWECEDGVQVQHQKQTSSQLLQFLREKAKKTDAREIIVMERNKNRIYTSSSPQSPTVRPQRNQFKHVATDDLINAQAPKMLSADTENHPPIFRVKRIESSGSLTYTCVIATNTELWDIGDIFTDVAQGDTNPLEIKGCQKIVAQAEEWGENIPWKTQILPCAKPEHEGNSSCEKTPAINGITIPEFHIRRFEELEVVVSQIDSPGDFYIQQADSVTKLQALVADSTKATRSYAEQTCIPDIGTKVMGWFPEQEQWCRAQVTKICGVCGDNNATDSAAGRWASIKVEVKRLDYGDTACLSLLNITELTPEMATLPLQAVQVSLVNVTPVNGRDWSELAVGWFQDAVHNRTFYARLYPEGPKVTVELFFEKGRLGAMRRGASLSLRLVENGHAKHSKLRNPARSRRSAIQVKMRKQDSEWTKYLISCYTKSSSENCECL